MGLYAIDCEMVGDVRNQSMVARVSLVDENLTVLIDEYVKPTNTVKDYRTAITGIRAGYENRALPKEQVVQRIRNIIRGNILVGHDIEKDLEVLGIDHTNVKDTATYRMRGEKHSLKDLARTELGIIIQNGSHDSIEDAKATMRIYKKLRF